MSISVKSFTDCITSLVSRVTRIENRIDSKNFVSHNITAGFYQGDESSGSATLFNKDALNFYSSGCRVTVRQNPIAVEIEPNNISVDFLKDGPPNGPPMNQTVPYIHFSRDGLFVWETATKSWRKAAGSGGGGVGNLVQGSYSPDPVSKNVQIPLTDGGNVELDIISRVGCNGIRLELDEKYFVDDHHYRAARSWEDLLDIIRAGEDALVCHQIVVTRDVRIESEDSSIMFVGEGSLDLAYSTIQLNVEILNPNNRQIFYNYNFYETMPDKFGKAPSVTGTFHENYNRDPRWWGLKVIGPVPNVPRHAANDPATAALNVDAIHAAARSWPFTHAEVGLINIQLPAGHFTINRTIRLDSQSCSMEGNTDTATGTTIRVGYVDWDKNSQRILTEDFPASATQPMYHAVETGYEITKGYEARSWRTEDDYNLRNFTIEINKNHQTDLIFSGIMWRSGMKHSKIENIKIENYDAYGIGGPNFLLDSSNAAIGSVAYGDVVTILENVVFDRIDVRDPNPLHADKAIGIRICGKSWRLSNSKVQHHTEVAAGQDIWQKPAVILMGDEACSVDNLYVSVSPDINAPSENVPCVHLTRGIFDSLKLHSFNLHSIFGRLITNNIRSNWYVLMIDNDHANVHASNIQVQGDYVAGRTFGGVPIFDKDRNKLSTTHVAQTGEIVDDAVSLYSRQMTTFKQSGPQTWEVLTTDPALR